MNQKALHTLEYDKIIEQLTECATSDPGRRKCRELLPMTEVSRIRKALTETGDAIARIFRNGSTSFGSNREFSGIWKALTIGAALDMKTLLSLADFLDNVKRVKAYGSSAGSRENAGGAPAEAVVSDSLTDYFHGLEPLPQVSREIRRCIISEDEMADDASPALKKIRREIGLTGEKVHDQLDRIVKGSAREYLQDAVITLRGDRYCVPVRAEHKSQISGIVHDQSSSGSTLFIEPAAVVELNNRLRELALEERAEIEEILRGLTAMAGEHVTAFSDNAVIMTELDFIFAKASLALSQNAVIPVFNEAHCFDIRKGRHPLIDKKKVVPIDVMSGRDYDMLIITGPNTGGKTVTLKTVGLLTLMGQAGLAIPAGDRSELSVFREIYADIGDEQSIEQSLSTFSSHMTNTVQILREADEDCLCIFDELGAGTDPTEGAALAVAILEYLHTRGIRTLATTHYSELKVYALTTPGVQNASCEFDVETLSPTYRLLIGIPGKSNAFAISQKLGLSQEIIESARAHIGQDEKRFEDLLADLETSRRTIEREQATIEAYKHEMEKLKAVYTAKQTKIDASREDILRQAHEEARDILQQAKTEADETIRAIRKSGDGVTLRELESIRTGMQQKISEKNEKLSAKEKNKQPQSTHRKLKPEDLHIGDSVRIVSMGLVGTVNSKPDKSGNLFVMCGIIRTKARIDDLVPVAEESAADQMKKFYGYGKKHEMDLTKAMHVRTEINLIGRNVEDALAELDKYLDDAYVAHLGSVRIVHGKGSGTLRRAVQEHLRTVPYVKSYKQAEYGEGDSGVTIATFAK